LRGSGFQAFVGASFAEIFFGNCTALGLPCVTLNESDLGDLMDAVELDPSQEVVVDLVAGTVTCRAGSVPANLPEAARQQLLGGNWDATSVLLEAGSAIESTASQLPYMSRFGDQKTGFGD
jgi:3-isopropylmalate/(R)-2-methylmalate dehydratase small subunit